MRRTPIAHVVFPRLNTLRPVPEFVWDAVQAAAATRDLDVSVLMPVPLGVARKIQGLSRKIRGSNDWPSDLEARLLALSPRPVLVPYLPLPRRSTESAAAAVAAYLVRLPRAGRPRLLQGSFLDEGGYAATAAARVLDCASIIVAHGSDVRAARGELPGIGRTTRALSAVRHASRVVAVSTQLAQELSLVGTRADVVSFTSPAALFPLAPPRQGRTILFVGRLSRAKGADLLLEALPRLKHGDARLVFVGPPADFDIRSEARRLGIEARVDVLPERARGDLAPLYAEAACLALPSRAEGLPCVLVESLLVGRPVVASEVGGVAELVDDTVGRRFPTENVAALADALDSVLATNFVPEQLRARALPFAWESSGPRLLELTRSLLPDF